MKLEQLMEDVPFTLVQGTLETEVEDIIYDSRKAAPGLLFVCIVGTQRDSHDLAADCVAKGVNTLVIQHDIDLSAMPDVNVIKVESSRYAMAKMSANLFGNPSRQMTMIGVTGTKGYNLHHSQFVGGISHINCSEIKRFAAFLYRKLSDNRGTPHRSDG